MKIFLAALVLVGLCVFGMCFNVIFRKKEFPRYDVGSNEEMRKRGIRCFKDEDAAIHNRINCSGNCEECTLSGPAAKEHQKKDRI